MEKADRVEIFERNIPRIRGVIFEQETDKHLTIRQFAPTCPDQLPWLAHVWLVSWDLPDGLHHDQRTIPFPVFNLVAEKQRPSALYGCQSGCFSYPLHQQGHVVGIRFKPACQGAFYAENAALLTDRSVKVEELFSPSVVQHIRRLEGHNPDREDIEALLSQLHREAGPIPEGAHQIGQMVDYIETRSDLYRVTDLAEVFGLSERSLQRQFHAHLGMGPKAVIDQFRIQNALHLTACGPDDFADLALRLGYFDQSHFINAFRRIIGHSPAEFSKMIRPAQKG